MNTTPYDRRYNPKLQRPNCDPFDIHQWQIEESKRQGNPPTPRGFVEQSGPTAASDPSPLSQPIADYAFYFDSVYSDTAASAANGQIAFSVVNLNSNNPIQNITSAHINSFYFPKIASTSAADFFYFRRVYLRIENIAQVSSVQAPAGANYHFEFNVEDVNGTCVLLTPVNPNFYFQAPITALSTIFFTFTIPVGFKPIPLPAPTVVVQAIPNSTPIATFAVVSGNISSIGPFGVPTPPGIAVFITGFVGVGTPIDPTVNPAVNNTNGIFITNILPAMVVPPFYPDRFEVAGIDFATVNSSNQPMMIIAKNRFAFPMRFTCLQPRANNGVIQVHV